MIYCPAFTLLFVADSPSEADWCLTLKCKHSTIAFINMTASSDNLYISFHNLHNFDGRARKISGAKDLFASL